jgi:hypothetical protein
LENKDPANQPFFEQVDLAYTVIFALGIPFDDTHINNGPIGGQIRQQPNPFGRTPSKRSWSSGQTVDNPVFGSKAKEQLYRQIYTSGRLFDRDPSVVSICELVSNRQASYRLGHGRKPSPQSLHRSLITGILAICFCHLFLTCPTLAQKKLWRHVGDILCPLFNFWPISLISFNRLITTIEIDLQSFCSTSSPISSGLSCQVPEMCVSVCLSKSVYHLSRFFR